MSNFERFGAKEVQNQDVEVSRETEVQLADYEALMDNVMEMVGDGAYVPTEAELKDMAQLADIPEDELKVLADAVTNSEVGFEDIKMMGIQPEGEYLAYCPFAGCGGTCRGCAGYR